MRKVLISVLTAGIGVMWSAYFCADTGFYYSDQSFCNSVCSSACEVLLDNSRGLVCDTANYELFIYNPQTNKTIAVSRSSDFWDGFQNLLVIEDVSDNEAGKQILQRLNTAAWIGLYDPNLSSSYNSVNPDRFVWYDGTAVGWTNWSQGQPDNRVDSQDIGVVSPLGEHWVYMDAGGFWNDDGYHVSHGGDYRPRRRALVMWRKQLDCVNGLSQSDQTTSQDLVDIFCGGQTPCYLCTDGDTQIGRCVQGQVSGSTTTDWLCSLGSTLCSSQVSCPPGLVLNQSAGRCEADPVISCPPGGSYNAQTGRCEASSS